MIKKELIFKEDYLISVIIPVYNTATYLRECLDSVCGQTYSNLEIIVVNDGSTDNSKKILKEYAIADKRIKIIDQENQGLSAARNAGLENATGEFVLFLDSDDWIDLETCEIAIYELLNTNADVIMWSYSREYPNISKPVYLFGESSQIWDEKTIVNLRKQFIGLQGNQLREPQKIDSIVTAWGKLYRKSIIGELQFVDTKIIGTEDALFNIMLFDRVKRATYIPKIFSHYRKTNADSLTHRYREKLVYQWQELYRRIELHLTETHAEKECYQALNNRIALGLIGIGLNLAEDDHLDIKKKKSVLKNILDMPHYRKALVSLPLSELPIHWKVFFICAKKQWTFLLLSLLLVMNRMRGR